MSLGLFEIVFNSKKDGKKHEFELTLPAPIDRLKHTYRLEWMASQDQYRVIQDGKTLVQGTITKDFSGFSDSENDGSSSRTLKDHKSQQISDLEDELAIVDEWIIDIANLKSDEMNSPDWQP